MESLRGHYVAVCKVPVQCRKEQVCAKVQPHLKRGRVLDAEEVSGVESSRDLTRWILWLASNEDANALCDMGRTDIEVEDRSVTVFFEKPLVCQVPKQWEKKVHEESSPVKIPVVPPRRHSSNSLHQQQVVGPYGLKSGFYHNIEPQVQIPRTGSEPFNGQGQFHGQRMSGYNQANWPQNVDGHLTGHQSGQHEAAYEVLWPNSMQNQNPHGDGKNYQDPNQFIGGGESQTSAYQRNNEYDQPNYNNTGNARVPMPMQVPSNQVQPIRPSMPYQQGSHGNMQFPVRVPYPLPLFGQQFAAPSPSKMQSQNPDIVDSKERPSASNMQGLSEPLPNSNYGTAAQSKSQEEGCTVNIQQEVKFEEIHMSKCTVEVTGPPKVVCEKELETIEMYFENKKSKGGTVKEIVFKDCAVYVTFESEEVAKRVAEKDDHMINKSPVSVKLLSMKTVNTSSAFTSMDFKKDFEMITQTTIRDSDEVNDINCSTCSENGQTQEATIYCKNCSVHLCTDCLKDHNKFPMMRTHDIAYSSGQADVGRAQEQESVEDIPKCVVHHANDVEKFCKEHDSVCCRTCVALKHRSCKTIISISQAETDILTCPEYKENISSLTKVLTAMTDEKNKERDSLTRLANDREQFLKDVDRYREDLHGRIDKLANGSQQKIKKMYSEVETKHHLNLSTLETVITATNHTLQNMTSQNSVKAFINMKACKNVVHECNALMHEMTIKMEEKKLKCNLNTEIIDKLNNTKTLLLEFPSK